MLGLEIRPEFTRMDDLPVIEGIDPKVVHLVIEQNEARKLWREGDTLEALVEMLKEENDELEEAISWDLPATPVGAEIGDNLYVYTKIAWLSKLQGTDIPSEAKAIYHKSMFYCYELGFNPNHVTVMKAVRNDMKYMHLFTNNGFQPQESRALCKGFWRHISDERFYEAWLEEAEVICDKLGLS